MGDSVLGSVTADAVVMVLQDAVLMQESQGEFSRYIPSYPRPKGVADWAESW